MPLLLLALFPIDLSLDTLAIRCITDTRKQGANAFYELINRRHESPSRCLVNISLDNLPGCAAGIRHSPRLSVRRSSHKNLSAAYSGGTCRSFRQSVIPWYRVQRLGCISQWRWSWTFGSTETRRDQGTDGSVRRKTRHCRDPTRTGRRNFRTGPVLKSMHDWLFLPLVEPTHAELCFSHLIRRKFQYSPPRTFWCSAEWSMHRCSTQQPWRWVATSTQFSLTAS